MIVPRWVTRTCIAQRCMYCSKLHSTAAYFYWQLYEAVALGKPDKLVLHVYPRVSADTPPGYISPVLQSQASASAANQKADVCSCQQPRRRLLAARQPLP